MNVKYFKNHPSPDPLTPYKVVLQECTLNYALKSPHPKSNKGKKILDTRHFVF